MQAGLEDVLAGLSAADAIVAIIAAGTIIAAVEFASWCVDQVANFFGDGSFDHWGEDWAACDACGGYIYEEDAFVYTRDGQVLCGNCCIGSDDSEEDE